MGNFLDNERKNRTTSFYKGADDESFLTGINEIIEPHELANYKDLEEERPTIFVHGLPRSGTTLLMQYLINSLDLGYINNLIARFWMAPVHGIGLSKILLNEQSDIQYKSTYGKTKELFGPHEFSYFWIKWLKMENMPPYYPESIESQIDWVGLKKVLLNIADALGKPMIYKGICPGYHLEKTLNVLQKSVFVYIKRDPVDVSCSLLKARRAYYDDPNMWWSMYPEEYEQIKNLEYKEQIPAQVYHLKNQYEKPMSKQEVLERTLIVDYREFCENPVKILDQLTQRLID